MNKSKLPEDQPITFFSAQKAARQLADEVRALRGQLADAARERDVAMNKLQELGALPILEIQARVEKARKQASAEVAQMKSELAQVRADIAASTAQLDQVRATIVATEDLALLQEAGVYQYQHILSDAVAYQARLKSIQEDIKAMSRKDGGAILSTTAWTVNGSQTEGRAMVRDFSKLMLRAFNAEADTLVQGLKPFKLQNALERLRKVADTIAKLGATMSIRVSGSYFELRAQELKLTADYLHKLAAEKEAERQERERLKEERRAQQEIEREKARLEKERKHYENALAALIAKGDDEGAARIRDQLGDVDKAIADVDYRAANIRAGYVYLISNIGSFGERMIKVGMTRRLDPLDRVRELGDASVPFNFDVHALFFSKDAVGIETAMHERLSAFRVNVVNRRREFFNVTPLEAKAHLAELAGELLEFHEVPEAEEYRQSLALLAVAKGDPSFVGANGFISGRK